MQCSMYRHTGHTTASYGRRWMMDDAWCGVNTNEAAAASRHVIVPSLCGFEDLDLGCQWCQDDFTWNLRENLYFSLPTVRARRIPVLVLPVLFLWFLLIFLGYFRISESVDFTTLRWYDVVGATRTYSYSQYRTERVERRAKDRRAGIHQSHHGIYGQGCQLWTEDGYLYLDLLVSKMG
jgi:hypothetical protein